jgi:hypothetical protein
MTGEPPEAQFTAEEANRLLPELTVSLTAIQQARRVVLAGGERVRRSAPANGGGRVGKDYWEALATLRREVESLAQRGIVLRDPESGLIDFPGRIEGQDAFLCWRLGEDRVAWWHPPETGFGGRRPL